MKRGAPEHPKMSRLAEILKIEHAHAVGIMEMLWHYTARFAIQGDVGRWPDDSIAHAVRWRGEPGKLIDALVKAGWLDRDPDYRLIVHDWDQHADQSVSKTLKNRALDFVCATRDHRVYFVRSAATGLIKIGTTRRPVKNRVADIQISSGERIEILCDVPGSFTLEVKFQEQFAEHRVSGEWFRDTPEIRQFIEELRVQNDSRSFRKISGKGWNDSRKEILAGGKSKPQPEPVPEPEPEPEPIITPQPPKGDMRALPDDLGNLIQATAAAMRARHAKPAGLGGPNLERKLTEIATTAADPQATIAAINRRHQEAVTREWRGWEPRYVPRLLQWLEEERYLDPIATESPPDRIELARRALE